MHKGGKSIPDSSTTDPAEASSYNPDDYLHLSSSGDLTFSRPDTFDNGEAGPSGGENHHNRPPSGSHRFSRSERFSSTEPLGTPLRPASVVPSFSEEEARGIRRPYTVAEIRPYHTPSKPKRNKRSRAMREALSFTSGMFRLPQSPQTSLYASPEPQYGYDITEETNQADLTLTNPPSTFEELPLSSVEIPRPAPRIVKETDIDVTPSTFSESQDVLCIRDVNERDEPPHKFVRVPLVSLKASQRYATVSPHGVTFVQPGGHSEFVPMADWLARSHAYDVVSKFDVFVEYRKWRGFDRWARFTRARRFERHKKNFLNCTAFMQPKYRSSLLSVVERSLKFREAVEPLTIPNPEMVYTLKDLSKVIDDARRMLRDHVVSYVDGCRAIVEQCARETRVADLIELGRLREEERVRIMQREKELRRFSGKKKAFQSNKGVGRFIVPHVSFTPAGDAMGRFVRLCDYVLLSHIVDVAMEHVMSFCELFNDSRPAPVFRVFIDFDKHSQIVTEPSAETLLKAVDAFIFRYLDGFRNPRLLFYAPFAGCLRKSGMEQKQLATTGPDFWPILNSRTDFIALKQSYEGKLVTAVEEGRRKMEAQFVEFSEIHRFAETMRTQRYISRDFALISETQHLAQVASDAIAKVKKLQQVEEADDVLSDESDTDAAFSRLLTNHGSAFDKNVPLHLRSVLAQKANAQTEVVEKTQQEENHLEYIGLELNFPSIAADFAKFRQWRKDVHNLSFQGIVSRQVFVDAKKLKNKLMTLPLRLLVKAHEFVTQKTIACENSLGTCMTEVLRILPYRPDRLDAFSDFSKAVVAIRKLYENMHVQVKHCEESVRILRTNSSINSREMDPTLEALHGNVKEMRDTLDALIEKADTDRESLSVKYRQQAMRRMELLHLALDEVMVTIDASIACVESPSDLVKVIDLARGRLSQVKQDAEMCLRVADVFDIEESHRECATKTLADIDHLRRLWRAARKWEKLYRMMMEVPLELVNIDESIQHLNSVWQIAAAFAGSMSHTSVVDELMKQVSSVVGIVPMLLKISCTTLKREHWEWLFRDLSLPFDATASLTMQHVDKNLVKIRPEHDDALDVAIDMALRDQDVESKLSLLERRLGGTRLFVKDSYSSIRGFKYGQEQPGVAGLADALLTLDDSDATLLKLFYDHRGHKFSAFVKRRLGEILRARRTIESVMFLQYFYATLMPFFQDPSFHKQMPEAFDLFGACDRRWRLLLRDLLGRPSTVLDLKELPLGLEPATTPAAKQVSPHLPLSVEGLSIISEDLTDYIRAVRRMAPRLQLLHNTDMATLWAAFSSPKKLGHALGMIFRGVVTMEVRDLPYGSDGKLHPPEDPAFSPRVAQGKGKGESDKAATSGASLVTAITVVVGREQRLVLCEPVPIVDSPVSIINSLEVSIQKSLRLQYEELMSDPPAPAEYVTDDVLDFYAGQVLFLCLQTDFTTQLKQALFETRDGSARKEALEDMLSQYTELLDACSDRMRPESPALSPRLMATLKMLVAVVVQHREIIHVMQADPPLTENSWNWLRLLRYEYKEPPSRKRSETSPGASCVVHHGRQSYEYGFGFCGVLPRPLLRQATEGVTLTYTTARSLNQVGLLLYGPPSAGKRRLFEDVASALGRESFMLDCSLQAHIDPSYLQQWLSAVLCCGFWGCFAHFPALSPACLNNLACILRRVRYGFESGATTFCNTTGVNILHHSTAIFATLESPLWSPSLPKREDFWRAGFVLGVFIPDALRTDLRPYAVVYPDACTLSEVRFEQEGFIFCKELSQALLSMHRDVVAKLSTAIQNTLPYTYLGSSVEFSNANSSEQPDKAPTLPLDLEGVIVGHMGGLVAADYPHCHMLEIISLASGILRKSWLQLGIVRREMDDSSEGDLSSLYSSKISHQRKAGRRLSRVSQGSRASLRRLDDYSKGGRGLFSKERTEAYNKERQVCRTAMVLHYLSRLPPTLHAAVMETFEKKGNILSLPSVEKKKQDHLAVITRTRRKPEEHTSSMRNLSGMSSMKLRELMRPGQQPTEQESTEGKSPSKPVLATPTPSGPAPDGTAASPTSFDKQATAGGGSSNPLSEKVTMLGGSATAISLTPSPTHHAEKPDRSGGGGGGLGGGDEEDSRFGAKKPPVLNSPLPAFYKQAYSVGKVEDLVDSEDVQQFTRLAESEIEALCLSPDGTLEKLVELFRAFWGPSGCPSVLILGETMSGKSTLVNALCHCIARFARVRLLQLQKSKEEASRANRLPADDSETGAQRASSWVRSGGQKAEVQGGAEETNGSPTMAAGRVDHGVGSRAGASSHKAASSVGDANPTSDGQGSRSGSVAPHVPTNPLAQMTVKGKVATRRKPLEEPNVWRIDPLETNIDDIVATLELEREVCSGLRAMFGVARWLVFDGSVETYLERLLPVPLAGAPYNGVAGEGAIAWGCWLQSRTGIPIPVAPTVRFVFESEAVPHCSPATLSKHRIVVLSGIMFSWQDVAETWIQENRVMLGEACRNRLKRYFTKIVYHMMDTVDQLGERLRRSRKVRTERMLCILDSLLKECPKREGGSNYLAERPHLLDALCTFSVVWGLGGALDSDQMAAFNKQLIALLEMQLMLHWPLDSDLFNMYVDIERERLIQWDMPAMQIPQHVSLEKRSRVACAASLFLHMGQHVIIEGEEGSGKSNFVRNEVLQRMVSTRHVGPWMKEPTVWYKKNVYVTNVSHLTPSSGTCQVDSHSDGPYNAGSTFAPTLSRYARFWGHVSSSESGKSVAYTAPSARVLAFQKGLMSFLQRKLKRRLAGCPSYSEFGWWREDFDFDHVAQPSIRPPLVGSPDGDGEQSGSGPSSPKPGTRGTTAQINFEKVCKVLVVVEDLNMQDAREDDLQIASLLRHMTCQDALSTAVTAGVPFILTTSTRPHVVETSKSAAEYGSFRSSSPHHGSRTHVRSVARAGVGAEDGNKATTGPVAESEPTRLGVVVSRTSDGSPQSHRGSIPDAPKSPHSHADGSDTHVPSGISYAPGAVGLHQRLLRHFNVISIGSLPDRDLTAVFTPTLDKFRAKFPPSKAMTQWMKQIAACTLSLYRSLQFHLYDHLAGISLPTPLSADVMSLLLPCYCIPAGNRTTPFFRDALNVVCRSWAAGSRIDHGDAYYTACSTITSGVAVPAAGDVGAPPAPACPLPFIHSYAGRYLEYGLVNGFFDIALGARSDTREKTISTAETVLLLCRSLPTLSQSLVVAGTDAARMAESMSATALLDPSASDTMLTMRRSAYELGTLATEAPSSPGRTVETVRSEESCIAGWQNQKLRGFVGIHLIGLAKVLTALEGVASLREADFAEGKETLMRLWYSELAITIRDGIPAGSGKDLFERVLVDAVTSSMGARSLTYLNKDNVFFRMQDEDGICLREYKVEGLSSELLQFLKLAFDDSPSGGTYRFRMGKFDSALIGELPRETKETQVYGRQKVSNDAEDDVNVGADLGAIDELDEVVAADAISSDEEDQTPRRKIDQPVVSTPIDRTEEIDSPAPTGPTQQEILMLRRQERAAWLEQDGGVQTTLLNSAVFPSNTVDERLTRIVIHLSGAFTTPVLCTFLISSPFARPLTAIRAAAAPLMFSTRVVDIGGQCFCEDCKGPDFEITCTCGFCDGTCCDVLRSLDVAIARTFMSDTVWKGGVIVLAGRDESNLKPCLAILREILHTKRVPRVLQRSAALIRTQIQIQWRVEGKRFTASRLELEMARKLVSRVRFVVCLHVQHGAAMYYTNLSRQAYADTSSSIDPHPDGLAQADSAPMGLESSCSFPWTSFQHSAFTRLFPSNFPAAAPKNTGVAPQKEVYPGANIIELLNQAPEARRTASRGKSVGRPPSSASLRPPSSSHQRLRGLQRPASGSHKSLLQGDSEDSGEDDKNSDGKSRPTSSRAGSAARVSSVGSGAFAEGAEGTCDETGPLFSSGHVDILEYMDVLRESSVVMYEYSEQEIINWAKQELRASVDVSEIPGYQADSSLSKARADAVIEFCGRLYASIVTWMGSRRTAPWRTEVGEPFPRDLVVFLRRFIMISCSRLAAMRAQWEHLRQGKVKYRQIVKLTEEYTEEMEVLAPQYKSNEASSAVLREIVDRDTDKLMDHRILIMGDVSTHETSYEDIRRKQFRHPATEVLLPPYVEAYTSLMSLPGEEWTQFSDSDCPPKEALIAVEGACVLLGLYSQWTFARKYIRDGTLLSRVSANDPALISVTNRMKVQDLLSENTPDWSVLQRRFKCAYYLGQWLEQVTRLAEVLEGLGSDAQEDFSDVRHFLIKGKTLEVQKHSLYDAEAKLQRLRDELKSILEKNKAIDERYIYISNYVDAGHLLVEATEGIWDRWESILDGVRNNVKYLEGTSLLVAGLLTFGASMTPSEFSTFKEYMRGQLELLSPVQDEDKSLFDFLGLTKLCSVWEADGLSSDEYAQMKALAIHCTDRVPVVYDPHGVGASWVRRSVGKAFTVVEIAATSSSHYHRDLRSTLMRLIAQLSESTPQQTPNAPADEASAGTELSHSEDSGSVLDSFDDDLSEAPAPLEGSEDGSSDKNGSDGSAPNEADEASVYSRPSLLSAIGGGASCGSEEKKEAEKSRSPRMVVLIVADGEEELDYVLRTLDELGLLSLVMQDLGAGWSHRDRLSEALSVAMSSTRSHDLFGREIGILNTFVGDSILMLDPPRIVICTQAPEVPSVFLPWVSVIRFDQTTTAAEETVLGDVISAEIPTVEENFSINRATVAKAELTMEHWHEQLFQLLHDLPENIGEEKDRLAKSLARSKEVQAEMDRALNSTSALESLATQREVFRRSAEMVAQLYWAAQGISLLCGASSWSLSLVRQQTKTLVDACPRLTDTVLVSASDLAGRSGNRRRQQNSNESESQRRAENVYNFVMRGLFERLQSGVFNEDKPIFALCFAIALSSRPGEAHKTIHRKWETDFVKRPSFLDHFSASPAVVGRSPLEKELTAPDLSPNRRLMRKSRIVAPEASETDAPGFETLGPGDNDEISSSQYSAVDDALPEMVTVRHGVDVGQLLWSFILRRWRDIFARMLPGMRERITLDVSRDASRAASRATASRGEARPSTHDTNRSAENITPSLNPNRPDATWRTRVAHDLLRAARLVDHVLLSADRERSREDASRSARDHSNWSGGGSTPGSSLATPRMDDTEQKKGGGLSARKRPASRGKTPRATTPEQNQSREKGRRLLLSEETTISAIYPVLQHFDAYPERWCGFVGCLWPPVDPQAFDRVNPLNEDIVSRTFRPVLAKHEDTKLGCPGSRPVTEPLEFLPLERLLVILALSQEGFASATVESSIVAAAYTWHFVRATIPSTLLTFPALDIGKTLGIVDNKTPLLAISRPLSSVYNIATLLCAPNLQVPTIGQGYRIDLSEGTELDVVQQLAECARNGYMAVVVGTQRAPTERLRLLLPHIFLKLVDVAEEEEKKNEDSLKRRPRLSRIVGTPGTAVLLNQSLRQSSVSVDQDVPASARRVNPGSTPRKGKSGNKTGRTPRTGRGVPGSARSMRSMQSVASRREKEKERDGGMFGAEIDGEFEEGMVKRSFRLVVVWEATDLRGLPKGFASNAFKVVDQTGWSQDCTVRQLLSHAMLLPNTQDRSIVSSHWASDQRRRLIASLMSTFAGLTAQAKIPGVFSVVPDMVPYEDFEFGIRFGDLFGITPSPPSLSEYECTTTITKVNKKGKEVKAKVTLGESWRSDSLHVLRMALGRHVPYAWTEAPIEGENEILRDDKKETGDMKMIGPKLQQTWKRHVSNIDKNLSTDGWEFDRLDSLPALIQKTSSIQDICGGGVSFESVVDILCSRHNEVTLDAREPSLQFMSNVIMLSRALQLLD
eukprot:Rmarinus@m.13757